MSHRPPPELGNDAIREILLRIPPEHPELLVGAACVCKAWRRIISDPAFRKFQRMPPPLLGILRNDFKHASFVPTTAFRPAVTVHLDQVVCDARHGRVLFLGTGCNRHELLVWDPITDAQHRVPWPTLSTTYPLVVETNLAVLCATTIGCDHRDCHRGPFLVALAYRSSATATSVSVYSWIDGAWSGAASVEHPEDEDTDVTVHLKTCGVVVGNTVYLSSRRECTSEILEYNMGNRELKVIGDLPAAYYRVDARSGETKSTPRTMLMTAVLVTTGDGKLGFAGMKDSSTLYLWSRKAGAGPDGALAWAPHRTIEIGTLSRMNQVAGFADEFGVFFVNTGQGLFMVELNSGRVRKVPGVRLDFSDFIIPYMSLYTLGSALHSSDHP